MSNSDASFLLKIAEHGGTDALKEYVRTGETPGVMKLSRQEMESMRGGVTCEQADTQYGIIVRAYGDPDGSIWQAMHDKYCSSSVQ